MILETTAKYKFDPPFQVEEEQVRHGHGHFFLIDEPLFRAWGEGDTYIYALHWLQRQVDSIVDQYLDTDPVPAWTETDLKTREMLEKRTTRV